jgi:hypothetical protein
MRVNGNWNPARRSGALAVLALAAAAGMYAVMVGTEGGRELDAILVDLELDNPVRRAFVAIGVAVNPVTLAVGGLIIATLAARRRGPSAGVAAAAIVGGAALLPLGLEPALGALDPAGGERDRALQEEDQGSYFPSGHVFAAMGLCLAAMLTASDAERPIRPAIAAAAATILAIPHFVTAWHHASDVLGSMLLTTAWAATVTACIPVRPLGPAHPAARWSRRRLLAALALPIAALALLEIGRRASVDLGSFQLGVLLMAAAVAGVAILVTRGYERAVNSPPSGGRRAPAGFPQPARPLAGHAGARAWER